MKGRKFKVLSDGFIRVVDYMGSDAEIVEAARISYGDGTRKVSDDEKLIRYLMRHQHTSPFEMAEVKLHLRVPMDCWRQFVRHRTASVNEYSTRYSVAIDAADITPDDGWRMQSTDNKQGSGAYFSEEEGNTFSIEEDIVQANAIHAYNRLLNSGVAREQARKVLPLSTYTEVFWKIDLNNLLRFLKLRMDSHAQEEIRRYANIIGSEIVAELFPLTWKAFLDYQLEALTFSQQECRALGGLLGSPIEYSLSPRERTEFCEKLRKITGKEWTV